MAAVAAPEVARRTLDDGHAPAQLARHQRCTQGRVSSAQHQDVVLGRQRHDVADGAQRLTSGGATSATPASSKRAAHIGRVTNTDASPSLIASARRHWSSASGPRISPRTAGTSGTSYTRIRQPIAPTAYSSTRSSIEPLRL